MSSTLSLDVASLDQAVAAGRKAIAVDAVMIAKLTELAGEFAVNLTIAIAISNDHGLIKCDITNSNHPKQSNDKSGSGIGLEQVKQRLALIYPHSHEWHYGVSDDGTTYSSTLILNSNDSQVRNS